MKFKIVNNLIYTPDNILRNCGYFSIFDQKTQKKSFVRKITGNRYPRFHLYLKEDDREVVFDLHLDQSKTVYSGAKAHNADYDSLEVKQELVRIFQEVKKAIPEEKETNQETTENESKTNEEKQPNWLSKLFKKN
jgi:hypothetical protein